MTTRKYKQTMASEFFEMIMTAAAIVLAIRRNLAWNAFF